MNLQQLIDHLNGIKEVLESKGISVELCKVQTAYDSMCCCGYDDLDENGIQVTHHDWDPDKDVTLTLDGSTFTLEGGKGGF